MEQIEDLVELENPANALFLAICRILNCFEMYPDPNYIYFNIKLLNTLETPLFIGVF